MNNKIIAIVPTHGAGDAFIECIDSILNQTYPIEGIIIINNNVKDQSVAQLQKKYKFSEKGIIGNTSIVIFQLNTNTGVTGGRNAGIHHLPKEYDYALFVDHDMIAKDSMVQELIQLAEKHNDAGIITPKIYYYENKEIIWAAGTDINLNTGQTLFYGGKDTGQYEIEKEVGVAPAILLVRKKVLEKVPEFDNMYFATYEDTDFCFAARAYGYKTWYSPSSIAYHKIPYDPQIAMKRLLDRSFYVARNRYLFLRKFNLVNLITIIFIPVYILYYCKLAIQYNNYDSIINYLNGLYQGLTQPILSRQYKVNKIE